MLCSTQIPNAHLCAGVVTVRSSASGSETAIADIVRAVEGAQARTAPVQRTADAISGKFAYAVMGLSAATFAFWQSVGSKVSSFVALLFAELLSAIFFQIVVIIIFLDPQKHACTREARRGAGALQRLATAAASAARPQRSRSIPRTTMPNTSTVCQ